MTSMSLHKCALCHEFLGDDSRIIMTIDFFTPTAPLAEYADVTMHEKCFLAWDMRDEFLLASNVIREQKQTPDGIEIIRLLRKHKPIIIQEYHLTETKRLEKEQEQKDVFASKDFVYLGNGPNATGAGPGWRMTSSLYLKCVLCGYMMVLTADEDNGCFCGALSKDAMAGRLGSRLGDAAIEVYLAQPNRKNGEY